jgi:hypothetical protein
MLTYDELVDGLEDAWAASGLHEHEIVESVQPEAHERTYKVGLFPDHADPLTEETMPPWVEVSFNWSAAHQLRSEGHRVHTAAPLEITWMYNVVVHGHMREQSDVELVRAFQKAVSVALQRFFPPGIADLSPLAVEVRRIYQNMGSSPSLEYVQLISHNITDLSELWDEYDPNVLSNLLQNEVDLASAVIYTLASIFVPGPGAQTGGRSSYQSVDAA